MDANFNELTPAQTERLAILAEECGEVLQIVGKVLRHGYLSYNPFDKTHTPNRELLMKELGDLKYATNLITELDLNANVIDVFAAGKEMSVRRYLHHQEAETNG